MREGENKCKNVTHGKYFNLSNNQATTHCTVFFYLYCSRIWFPGGLFCINSSVFTFLAFPQMHIYKKISFLQCFKDEVSSYKLSQYASFTYFGRRTKVTQMIFLQVWLYQWTLKIAIQKALPKFLVDYGSLWLWWKLKC